MTATNIEHTGTFTREGDRVVVVGHVRPQNRRQLQDLATAALAERGRCTIDLRDAGYIDSSGIATLITIALFAKNQRKELVIAHATSEFRQMVDSIAGLRDVITFTLHGHVEAATS